MASLQFSVFSEIKSSGRNVTDMTEGIDPLSLRPTRTTVVPQLDCQVLYRSCHTVHLLQAATDRLYLGVECKREVLETGSISCITLRSNNCD